MVLIQHLMESLDSVGNITGHHTKQDLSFIKRLKIKVCQPQNSLAYTLISQIKEQFLQTWVIITRLLSEVEAQSHGFICLPNTSFGTLSSQAFVLEVMTKQNMDLLPLMVLMEKEELKLINLLQCLTQVLHLF